MTTAPLVLQMGPWSGSFSDLTCGKEPCLRGADFFVDLDTETCLLTVVTIHVAFLNNLKPLTRNMYT